MNKLIEEKGKIGQILDGLKNDTIKWKKIKDISKNALSDSLMDTFNSIIDATGISSPLVIDLDGTRFETLSLKDGVYFDHQGNGFRIKSGWVGSKVGILVRDINANGKIDNGLELFGNFTRLKNGKFAANGFEALKDLDSNKDGIFDVEDEIFEEVKIWVDKNTNGRTEPDEIFTLKELGIVSINLNYENVHIMETEFFKQAPPLKPMVR